MTYQRPDDTTPLRHSGPCGRRIRCWRPDCQERFGEARTVEILPTGEWLAFCHRTRWHPRPVEVAA